MDTVRWNFEKNIFYDFHPQNSGNMLKICKSQTMGLRVKCLRYSGGKEL